MKKQEFIKHLETYPDNAEILIDDHEHRDYCEIDGIRHNKQSNIVIISTGW